jgi:hypothetical protein
MTQRKNTCKKVVKKRSNEPSPGTKKKPSSTLAKAKAKRKAQLERVQTELSARQATRLKRPSSLPASSTTARGGSSVTSSKGALGKLRTRRNLARSLPSGAVSGAFVLCTWPYERNFGAGEGVFTGTIKSIDDPPGWIKIFNPGAQTMLHWPAHYFTIKVMDSGN